MEARFIPELEEDTQSSHAPGTTISPVNHRGWADSFLLSNGIVEVVVVPAIGRVMQFRLAGERDGTFWENHALSGSSSHLLSDRWVNFGGDKCWPAPQSAWPQLQGRAWPPPAGFDAVPMRAEVKGSTLWLTSAIDPGWGIEVARSIELEVGEAVLRIRTEFRKLARPPVEVAIWVITQMQEPDCVCMVLNPESRFDGGSVRLLEPEPSGLHIRELPSGIRLLSLKRHRHLQTKVGADGSSMAWIGPASVVRIDVETMAGVYPDGGCITEVYTNPDPLGYVELETMGPLTTMRVGDCMRHDAIYRISPRSSADPIAEARRVFNAGFD